MVSVFAQNLKYLRNEKGFTQSQLAEILHYTQSNICEWEKGTVEPKASALITLANYFEVSIEYLLGLEDDFGGSVGQKEAPQFTAEERELLEDYRELSAPGKQLVKTTVKTLLDGSSAKSTSKKFV